MKQKILIICGPTASGKTRLAIELAQLYNGEIVSADSMQIYRKMDIGTAKPNAAERAAAPHHLLDIIDAGERYSVAEYVKAARLTIDGIINRGKLPIVAGGTGLYIDSLIGNTRYEPMERDETLRAELRGIAKERGNEALHEMLRQADPAAAAKLHANDVTRVARALEVISLTGEKMSDLRRKAIQTEKVYDSTAIVLCTRDRNVLYDRINARVDQMLKDGLADEARGLLDSGVDIHTLQAIGYKELAGFLDGQCTLQQAAEEIKKATRNYAKRQLTWFRHMKGAHWIETDTYPDWPNLVEAAEKIIDNG